MTLGVMSLEEETAEVLPALTSPAATSDAPRALSTALALLASLRPRILVAMDGQPLRVPLELLDIMRPHRGGTRNAHVMFIGPLECEANRRLRSVCGACLILFCSGRILIFDPCFTSGCHQIMILVSLLDPSQRSLTPLSSKPASSKTSTGR